MGEQMIKIATSQTWARIGTASRVRAPGAAYSCTRQDLPGTEPSQFIRGVSAGGGRSRVRTWVGLADGFTDIS